VQWSFNSYDVSSNNGQYLTPECFAAITHGWHNWAARVMTPSRLYSSSPHEKSKSSRQIHQNLNDNHSDPIEITRTLCLPDITNCLWQQGETHLKYAALSTVVHDRFSIIPDSVGGKASFSHRWDIIHGTVSNYRRDSLE
jgi:hypothetical protein